ncbi:MAG: GNAT family N-acetyltransferase [Malacoplasma sp.]|nr:GNAT family N-acetyltransferase [Malacoplasma sp.]
MKIISDINSIGIQKVMDLYQSSFDDPPSFCNAFFNSYFNPKKDFYFGVVDNNYLVMNCFFLEKRVRFNNQNLKGYLIYGVSVDPNYQHQKIMTTNLLKFINQMQLNSQLIFIQANDWNIYKHIDFKSCFEINYYALKKDQFLKPIEVDHKINYDKINWIYNQFIKVNKIKNFYYKTSKENKKYLKLHQLVNAKIMCLNNSYLIYWEDEKEIIEYAYLNLKDFIYLVSLLPLDTKIRSYIELDKRFFKSTQKNAIITKVYNSKFLNNENQSIFSNDIW